MAKDRTSALRLNRRQLDLLRMFTAQKIRWYNEIINAAIDQRNPCPASIATRNECQKVLEKICEALGVREDGRPL